ncbi:MAG TPA: GNAT family N-acetyltransferase [Dongiaceae bacterium]|nr:GNAT family N-acetyltransferase [Dongiaceae bacterium]
MPAAGTYVLNTRRLTLRPLAQSDLADLVQIVANPDVVRTMLGDVSSLESTRAYAQGWICPDEFWDQHHYGFWGVVDRHGAFGATDRVIGVVGADVPALEVGEGPEVYYIFARDVWRKRVASEAVYRMFDYLFEVIGLSVLEAVVFAERNPGSVRILEKAGMRLVGRLPNINHHVTPERALKVMQFDIWRVRNAAPDEAEKTLADAAFRIGQLLAEGVGSREATVLALTEAAISFGSVNVLRMESIVERGLLAGAAAKGCAHYRLHRNDYLSRRPAME